MFADRYFPPRYFPNRYFGEGGAAGPVGPPTDDAGGQNARRRRIRVTYRYAILLPLLFALGCAHGSLRLSLWPEEEHGGVSGRPAASDLYFIAAGAVTDATLVALKVKPWWRLGAGAALAVGVRTLKPLGRTESSHFLFGFGVTLAEIVQFPFCRGPCHR